MNELVIEVKQTRSEVIHTSYLRMVGRQNESRI